MTNRNDMKDLIGKLGKLGLGKTDAEVNKLKKLLGDDDVKVVNIDLNEGLDGLLKGLAPLASLLKNVDMKDLLKLVPQSEMVDHIYDMEANEDSPQHFKDALAALHKSFEMMATEEIRERIRATRTEKEEWATACHEGAHAIMAIEEPTYVGTEADSLEKIWLTRADDPNLAEKLNFKENGINTNGYAAGVTKRIANITFIGGCPCPKHVKEAVNKYGKEKVIKALKYDMMLSLAGPAASQIVERWSGPSEAIMKTGKSDAKAAVRELAALSNLENRKIKDEDVIPAIEAAYYTAKAFIEGQWKAVEAVARELIKTGELDAETVRRVARANWNPAVKLAF